jgi:hypothetical protein
LRAQALLLLLVLQVGLRVTRLLMLMLILPLQLLQQLQLAQLLLLLLLLLCLPLLKLQLLLQLCWQHLRGRTCRTLHKHRLATNHDWLHGHPCCCQASSIHNHRRLQPAHLQHSWCSSSRRRHRHQCPACPADHWNSSWQHQRL